MTSWLEQAMRAFARRFQREQEEAPIIGDAPRQFWEDQREEKG